MMPLISCLLIKKLSNKSIFLEKTNIKCLSQVAIKYRIGPNLLHGWETLSSSVAGSQLKREYEYPKRSEFIPPHQWIFFVVGEIPDACPK